MHIVVADSSRTLAHLLAEQIEQRGDTVRTFCDGAEAYSYVLGNPEVDVVLTSLELDHKSGVELCWDVRVNLENLRSNYLIVMSSSNDMDKLIESLDGGADDYLQKPFTTGELYARLRNAERYLKGQRDLIRAATIDPLTNVRNRRAFFQAARSAFEEAVAGEPVSMIMLDIDHFKRINDSYGHEGGDRVLTALAEAIGDHCPVFGRLGGEEFAAVLAGRSAAEAFAVAEAMRVTASELRIPVNGQVISITCSFGVSEREDESEPDKVLSRADMALYAAKRSGRNRTVVDHPETRYKEAV